MILALLLVVALAVPARSEHNLVFDVATQSVRVTGIAPDVLEAIQERSSSPAALGRILQVFFEDTKIAMLGDYTVTGGEVRFTPRLPLLAARTYRAVLNEKELLNTEGGSSAGTDKTKCVSFRVDALKRAATRVIRVYPTGEVVPANLLRIYVLFSQPMSREVQSFIRLLDERDIPVEHPFLDTQNGLWDPEGRRLTLILDPGRIKRGLALHDSMGPPLRSRESYSLVVAKEAEDADGLPLEGDFRKDFRVGPEDRSAPDPRRWTIEVPRACTREPVIAVSDKPLDESLFARCVRAEDSTGQPVTGSVVVEQSGTRWRFTPIKPWRSGQYILRVGATLEDLAGNRPGRLFDEPSDPSGKRREAHEMALQLNIRR